MTRGRGTPGYAAPEVGLPLPVSQKFDVTTTKSYRFAFISDKLFDFDIWLHVDLVSSLNDMTKVESKGLRFYARPS
ncbi:hypothetical protein L2E82_07945 [Cichorium intybus]|uniref:Uncharacterized protein n=1 Tax=Cichorium intybus TaxID=13427 RepID=A0ACB9G578_CICIN|nr:hypothetical protein L2E82_07945 [Cichorium intybus]